MTSSRVYLLSQVCALALLSTTAPVLADPFEVGPVSYHIYADGTINTLVTATDGFNSAYFNINGTGDVFVGDLPGGINNSLINGYSNNLQFMTGFSAGASGNEAFVWSQSGGMVGLGILPGYFETSGRAVSEDGTVVSGVLAGPGGLEGFRWTQAGGMIPLGYLPGGTFSDMSFMSRDGSVISGHADDITGNFKPVRWTQAGGMVDLGTLPGSNGYTLPYGMSADGSTVVGYNEYFMGGEAFVWTQAGGLIGIGFLGSDTLSAATTADYDGDNVFGYSFNSTAIAFRWRADTGTVSIADILAGVGVDTSAYDINYVYKVSDDGRYISGPATEILTSTVYQYYADLLGGGIITDAEVLASLNSFVPLPEQAIQRTSVQIGQSLYAARLQPLMSAGITGGLPLRIPNNPEEIDPAAGDDMDVDRFMEPSKLSGFMIGSLAAGQDNDLDNWGINGTTGFKLPVTENISVGLAISGSQSDTEGQRDSETKLVSKGASFISSYRGENGLRVYSSLFGALLEADTKRGYFNGADLTASHGKTNGYAYGGAIRVGLEKSWTATTTIEPFIEGHIAKVHLDGYTEDDGIFPATFSDQSEISSLAKIGANVVHDVNDKLRVNGQLALVHLPEARNSTLQVTLAGNNFTSNGQGDTDTNWVEGSFGAQYQMNDDLGFTAEFNTRSGQTQSPEFALTLGLSYNF